jgi:hypothetical protein
MKRSDALPRKVRSALREAFDIAEDLEPWPSMQACAHSRQCT